MLALATMLAALSTSAWAADVPATANSLNNHVWASYDRSGALGTGVNVTLANGGFNYPSNGVTLSTAVGPAITVSRFASRPTDNFSAFSVVGDPAWAPGSNPVANSGFPANPPVQNDLINSAMRYQFSAALPTGSIVWINDLDVNESIQMQFFDCAGTLLNPSGYDAYLLSTSNLPIRSFTATTVTFTTPGTGNQPNPTAGVIIRSGAVCQVQATHTTAAPGGNRGDAGLFFSIPWTPRIFMTKRTFGGTGTFTYTGTNGFTQTNVTTTGVGVWTRAPAMTVVAAANTATTVTESDPGSDWRLIDLFCQDANTFVRVPGATYNIGARTATIPASAMPNNAQLECAFTNLRVPRIFMTKRTFGGTGTFTYTGTNGFSQTSVTTTAEGVWTRAPVATAVVDTNVAMTVTESDPGPGWRLTDLFCQDANTFVRVPGATYDIAARTANLPASAMTDGARLECAFTNTRTAAVTLRKAWVNGKANDAVSLSIGGAVGATAGSSVAGGVATAATATADMGATVTLTEAFTTGTEGNYTTTLACVDANNATVAVTGTGLSRTITMPATAVTCTYTNSRIAQQLNLAKTWATGATTNHTAGATTTGGTNNPSFSSIAPTNTTGTALVVYAGDAVTLPVETFGGGATAANYNAVVACTGGTTLTSATPPQSITVTASTTATTCTYTNTAAGKSLTLRKQWRGAVANDDASLTVSSGGTPIDTFESNADSADELDTDPTPTVVSIGTTVTLAETLPSANAGRYDQTLACTGAADTDPSDGLTIAAADTAIVCTFTNTRQSANLSIAKTNTPAAGPHDQAGDSVARDADTTYSLRVTNHGSSAVTGAVVSDTPVSGLDCPSTNPVTCTGTGCPGGAITVGALNSGVVLGTLPAGEGLTLSFSCKVR